MTVYNATFAVESSVRMVERLIPANIKFETSISVSYTHLYSLVWEDAYLGDENAVNVHISRLRNKIEDDARNPEYIITVWGFGYRIGG